MNKSKRVKNQIWFCNECGGHLESQDTLCKNKICVLFHEIQSIDCSTRKKCLQSNIEKKRKIFLNVRFADLMMLN